MTVYLLYPALSTHRGQRRDRNEDAVGYRYPATLRELREYGALFLLADGVGGLEHGERASDQTLHVIMREYYRSPADTIAARLVEAVRAANTALRQQPNSGATTLIAAVICGDTLTVAHVGDSAAFWLDGSGIHKLTEEHVMYPDPQNPKKRKLTRAVGHQDQITVDTVSGPVSTGGRLLLCSDGVTRYLDEAQCYDLCAADPADAVTAIVNAANQAGGADNISAVVVAIGGLCPDDAALRQHQRRLTPYIKLPDVLPAEPSPPPTGAPEPAHIPAPDSPLPAPAPRRPARRKLLVPAALLVIALAVVVVIALSGGGSSESGGTTAPATLPAVAPGLDQTAAAPVSGPLRSGDRVTFADSALTFTRVGGDVAAFVIAPARLYLVQDLYTDRQAMTWFRLYDIEGEQNGWITEGDLPDYQRVP